jgi:uncharacterized membrane protein YiaA
MDFKARKPNMFEQVVFSVGVLVLIVGYYLINKVLNTQGYKLTWDFLQTLFLWLLMVIFIILLAISEDIKESIMLNQTKEIRLLREALNRKR